MGPRTGRLTIAKRYEPRVQVITGPNCGASAARTPELRRRAHHGSCSSIPMTALEPGTLLRRLTIAKERQADVVITDWRDVIDDGSGTLRMGADATVDWGALEANAELATAAHMWATTAAILYRRSVVERIGGFRSDLPVIQDARFLFDAAFRWSAVRI